MTQDQNTYKPIWEFSSEELKEQIYYTYSLRIIGKDYQNNPVLLNRMHSFQGFIRGPKERSEWAKVVKSLALDFQEIEDFEILEQERITMVHTISPFVLPDSEDKYIESP